MEEDAWGFVAPLQDPRARCWRGAALCRMLRQHFGDEPFPGAKEGEFGVGQAGFS